ncbi:putative MFS family arabinose efflux permease [Comamonas odontotermitis]|uniref:MFS family arabinose efflux permease n=1 Tax=Comamonas odontotermitis TaxID=379895 RepID=A0ABR6RIV2_9BURK|nr:MFS transporter [Comamonas odontotermitis]MBB6579087.1 putative MFS family arabinose efflux permease [Comamonas odontotermitis]
MNRSIAWLALCQGLFLTNNVVFIAINGLVGLHLAPASWMATLPVMGYVVGGALSTPLVARSQARLGRQGSFQLGLLVALGSAALCALAAYWQHFVLLCLSTLVAGYYSANGQLYRFAAAELVAPAQRDKAISLVLAGGLIGAVLGPGLASATRTMFATPFLGAYLALMVVAVVSMGLMRLVRFAPQAAGAGAGSAPQRTVGELLRQPGFAVATLAAAASYGVMNLLMAATPLAMDVCGFDFSAAAGVLQWHVIGMFAPGFFTGHLIKRFGVMQVMFAGVVLNAICVGIALSGQTVMHFTLALSLLGVGWNFLFTGSTTLAVQNYRPEEKDRAQACINFFVFATMAVTSFASGALVTSQGWNMLNLGSIVPLVVTALAMGWLVWRQKRAAA